MTSCAGDTRWATILTIRITTSLPARLDKYLAGTATLPDQTRQYVAAIGPNIQGVMPMNRSPSEQLALNQLPLNIPGGLRYARTYAVASRRSRHSSGERAYAANAPSSHFRYPPQSRFAALSDPNVARVSYHLVAPEQPERDDRPHLQFASATQHGSHGFHLISTASAEPMPMIRRGSGSGSGGWGIQVGAFGNEGQARAAAESARGAAGGRSAIGAVHQARGTLYRARLTGMSHEAAVSACEKMHRGACMVLSPAAQS
jgi:hypothetical protein